MINKLIDFTLKKPNLIITIFVILFLLSLGNIPFLTQVSDISQLISKQDKVIKLNNQMEEIFGSTRLGLITFKDGLSPERFAEAKNIYQNFLNKENVTDVISIFSEKYLAGGDGSFEVEDIVSEEDLSELKISTIKEKLESFPLYKYSLFEGSNLNYLVQFKSDISDQLMSEIIEDVISKSKYQDSLIASGWPKINNSIKGIMDRDLFILIPLVFLIITIIFYYLFRSWRGIIIPLLTITIAIVCAVGFMAFWGISLNVVSNSIPILLVAIGTSDSVHFLAKYYHYADEFNDHNKLLNKTAKIIAPTILLTSITTMGGFLANLTSPVQSISEFGLVTACGVFFAGVASYLLIPALLTKFKVYPKQLDEKKHEEIFKKIATNVYNFLIKFKFQSGIIFLGLVLLSIYNIYGLQANYTLLGYFSPDSNVVVNAQKVSKSFGGLIEFNIVVDTKKSNGLIDSNILQAFDKVSEKYKSKYPDDIVFMTSLADYIKNMSKAYNGEDQYYRISENKDEISQYLEVYSWSGEVEEDLKYVTDPSYQKGRIYGRFKLQENQAGRVIERNLRYYENIVNEISQDLNKLIQKDVDIKFYGELPMWITTLYNIVEGQISSVFMAILVVFIMALPILRSLSLTLIGLIPIAIAISFNFAFMNLFNIQLDIATSLVSAMAIGIGIDDALHFLLTFKRIRLEKEDLNESLLETMQITGKAIFSTSITLVLGYSVFFFSSFRPINHFGLLNIITIILATIATIITIPLAILIFKPMKTNKVVK